MNEEQWRKQLEKLSPTELAKIAASLTPRRTKYIPWEPFPKQALFLNLTELEAFFGGAAGPGKSIALLMGALAWVDQPNYAAIIFRRQLTDLQQPGALMDVAAKWLTPTDAKWRAETSTWTFPSGATLSFGYLFEKEHRYRYAGTEFSYVAFDEVTSIDPEDYAFLMSRLRRTIGSPIPLRMRSASNPGGPFHDFYLERFILPAERARLEGIKPAIPFIPANMNDNPALDKESYERALEAIPDPVLRRQLREGDWHVKPMGTLMQTGKIAIVPNVATTLNKVRSWDLAGTEADPRRRGHDPDYTRGALVSKANGVTTMEDLASTRNRPIEVEKLLIETAKKDGRQVPILFEAEPGSSGKALIDQYRRGVLQGYAVYERQATGMKKELRARPLAADMAAGLVQFVQGDWNSEARTELAAFGTGATHDDIVDALSNAHAFLAEGMTSQEWLTYWKQEQDRKNESTGIPEKMSEARYDQWLQEKEAKAREALEARKERERAAKAG